MKNEKREEINEVCKKYKENYTNIFKYLYPAKNSTGFTEKNQSVNFAKALEQYYGEKGNECLSWYEFQFGDKNNLHFDAIMINITRKEIFIIEAKRYSNVEKKIIEVGKDILRLINLNWVKDDNNNRINLDGFSFFGVILSDVWQKKGKKEKIISQWDKIGSDFRFYSNHNSEKEMNLDSKKNEALVEFTGKVNMSVSEYVDSEFNKMISFEKDIVCSNTIKDNYKILVSVFEIPLN